MRYLRCNFALFLQEIEALVKCHKEHPYAKFWGTCNEVKWRLDACFREEKALNRYVLILAQGFHAF